MSRFLAEPGSTVLGYDGDNWLNVYERHIPEHIEQMLSNYDEWMKRKDK